MNDLEDSIKLLKSFLNKETGAIPTKDQIEWLKSHDFSEYARGQGCHEDSTDIVKAIYFILWHNKLPNMTTLAEMNDNYGGETINAFNTLFQQELEGINKFISRNENPDFYDKIENFKNSYLTIGNFMLLPNKKADNLSINQKKGSCRNRYKDYFDLFAVALFHSNEFDEHKQANKFYFDKIDEKKFYEINFLDKYIKDNEFQILFKHEKDNGHYYPYYHWKYSKPKTHTQEYVEFATDYMQKVEDIIKYRANVICKILKDIIP